MMARQKIPMPPQHSLGPDHQSHPMQDVVEQPVQQSSQEGPIGRGEPYPLAVQLSFENRKLVAQSENFGILGPIAHRQQSQHRQRIGHAQVRQSKKHSTASWPMIGGEAGGQDSDRRKISPAGSDGL
jgi:hypothetical protein